jgi:tripartite-type tricarboxylate transporter receptor subunit TctC
VIDKLAAAAQAAIKEPDFRKRMSDLGATVYAPEQSTPAALAAQLKSEIERWTPVIKAAGVYAD